MRCLKYILVFVLSAFCQINAETLLERYALDNPDRYADVTTPEPDEEVQSAVFKYHLKTDESDAKLLAAILEAAQAYEDENNRSQVYKAYIKREDTTIEQAEELVKEVKNFAECYRTRVYKAYLGREDADDDIMDAFIVETEDYQDEWCVARVFKAYINRKGADHKIVLELIEKAEDFTDEDYTADVYVAYIKSPGANGEKVRELVRKSDDFDDDECKKEVSEADNESAHSKGNIQR